MNPITTVHPENCQSKEEVREQIDEIDKEIISLFAQRFSYVKAIVKFKNDPESIVARQRKDDVIRQRGEWASELGLDKSTFEKIYELLIDHNISREMEIFGNRQKSK